LHDVTTVRHARKAVECGVDGLILICAGAGGHGGALSPFAFMQEVRAFYDGPLLIGGGIGSGSSILGVEALGGIGAYVGTRFLGALESLTSSDFKSLIFSSNASDVVYTSEVTGVRANFLSQSLNSYRHSLTLAE